MQASPNWSLSILVSGRFDILFEDRTEELRAPGDFVDLAPGYPA